MIIALFKRYFYSHTSLSLVFNELHNSTLPTGPNSTKSTPSHFKNLDIFPPDTFFPKRPTIRHKRVMKLHLDAPYFLNPNSSLKLSYVKTFSHCRFDIPALKLCIEDLF